MARVAEEVVRRISAGSSGTLEEVTRVVAEELGDKFPDTADRIAQNLVKDQGRLARALKRDKRLLAVTLEEVWGEAFSSFDAYSYSSYELGASWATIENQTRPAAWSTLLDLHARACQVAAEIGELQRAGFPVGAAARARSLHELAVVALVLRDADEEICFRYLDFAAVEQYDDAMQFNLHAASINYEPIPPAEMDALRAARDQVVERWGPGIKNPNGWAAPLLPKGGGFAGLEKLAGIGHLRPYYRYGSHAVHAGPRASILQLTEIDGVPHRTPGSTILADFGETGQLAVINLHQINAALMGERIDDEYDVDSLVLVMALQRLLDRTAELMGEASAEAKKRGWVIDSKSSVPEGS